MRSLTAALKESGYRKRCDGRDNGAAGTVQQLLQNHDSLRSLLQASSLHVPPNQLAASSAVETLFCVRYRDWMSREWFSSSFSDKHKGFHEGHLDAVFQTIFTGCNIVDQSCQLCSQSCCLPNARLGSTVRCLLSRLRMQTWLQTHIRISKICLRHRTWNKRPPSNSMHGSCKMLASE